MQIERRGSGPPLVMIHGWAMHCGLFGSLLDALAARRSLYLVDLPGHGRSREDASTLDLGACVRAIAAATPPSAWLGWSLGGLLALSAAAREPGVQALVMLCSTPRFVHADTWPQGMDVEVFRRFEAGLQADVHATVERFLALETLGCEQARSRLRELRTLAFAHGDPAPTALAAGLDLLEQADLRHLLPGLPVPSLWIGARRDRLVDPRAVATAAALASDSRHIQLDSGHAPFLTHAEELAGAIVAFLESSLPAPRQPLSPTPLPVGEGLDSRTIEPTHDLLSSPSPTGRGVGVRDDGAFADSTAFDDPP